MVKTSHPSSTIVFHESGETLSPSSSCSSAYMTTGFAPGRRKRAKRCSGQRGKCRGKIWVGCDLGPAGSGFWLLKFHSGTGSPQCEPNSFITSLAGVVMLMSRLRDETQLFLFSSLATPQII